MANIKISLEEFVRQEYSIRPSERDKKGFPEKFREFRQEFKKNLDDCAKHFQHYFNSANDEGTVYFFIREDDKHIAEEIFAKLRKEYKF